MRQQLYSSYKTPDSQRLSTVKHGTLKQITRKRRERNRGESAEITVTPMRGFFIALLFLGVPTISLGGLCFSLLQNNLRLTRTNSELSDIANEVKAEIDDLGEEIDSLKARAGVDSNEAVEPTSSSDSQASKSPSRAQDNLQSTLPNITVQSAAFVFPVRGGGSLARDLTPSTTPRGGPSPTVTALDLLRDAKQQVPELNKALDSSIKPALEKTLAEEAAYPSGQPVVGRVIVSSEFGIRSNPFSGSGYEVHEGMDFVGDHGDIIAAAGDGVITLAGYNGGYGNTVTIEHGYGYETLYAHMSEVKVKVGDRVKRGQIIGHIGSTGRSSGPHLHYSLYKNDKAIDPRSLLKLPENILAEGPR